MPELVYDGGCGICSLCARWVDRNCPGVATVSHRERGMDSIDKVMWRDGSVQRDGARAVAAVLRRARHRRHRALGSFVDFLPVRPVSAVVYALVARNRTRISRLVGATACDVPGMTVSASRDSEGASDDDATNAEAV